MCVEGVEKVIGYVLCGSLTIHSILLGCLANHRLNWSVKLFHEWICLYCKLRRFLRYWVCFKQPGFLWQSEAIFIWTHMERQHLPFRHWLLALVLPFQLWLMWTANCVPAYFRVRWCNREKVWRVRLCHGCLNCLSADHSTEHDYEEEIKESSGIG